MSLRILVISFLKSLLPAVLVLVLTPATRAQHVGGHLAGGGARVYAPPISLPPVSRPPVARPLFMVPAVRAFQSSGSLLLRPVPFRPRPIYFFGPRTQFRWFWAVWSYNSCAWVNCYFWNWSPSYNAVPFFEYSPAPAYPYSLYLFYGQGRELPQLFLKDGTVYGVTDYWLVDQELHFKVFDERRGKPVEQVIPLEDLDQQTTVDANTRRGFRFVLRDEPLEEYLEHHPNQAPPDWTPAQN